MDEGTVVVVSPSFFVLRGCLWGYGEYLLQVVLFLRNLVNCLVESGIHTVCG